MSMVPGRTVIRWVLATDPSLPGELHQSITEELLSRYQGNQLYSILVQLNKEGATGYLSRYLSDQVKRQVWNEIGSTLEERWPEVYRNERLSADEKKHFILLYNLDLITLYHTCQPQITNNSLPEHNQLFGNLVTKSDLRLRYETVARETNQGYPLLLDPSLTTVNSLINCLKEQRLRELLTPYYHVLDWRVTDD